MSAVPADLSIACRRILPMTAAREVLDDHTLVVRDGRILDLLPQPEAALRYAATVHVDRDEHLLLPGLVNSCTQIVPPAGTAAVPQRLHDEARLGIAGLLRNGTTCFCSLGSFPREAARVAAEQGMRAVIGIPIAEAASPWARSPGEYLTKALDFRDEYRGHPGIATAFAPCSAMLSDATFGRIATLADELDAGIVLPLHESPAAVGDSRARYGLRPMERMQALGLLTPALTAAHMVAVNADDLALALRGGIAITSCPAADFRCGSGPAPVAAWAAAGLRLSVGSGVGHAAGAADLWSELKLLALLSHAAGAARASLDPWDVLAAATRGGGGALGLDEIGTLQQGQWADLCCVRWPATVPPWEPPAAPQDIAAHLVYDGGRDLVSDVWVAGRHLLSAGAFTRLDRPDNAQRPRGRRESATPGD